MRPISKLQSLARNPLNAILSSEGAVRALRVLTARAPIFLTAAQTAKLAGTDVNGTRRTLAKLVQTGIVRSIGDTVLEYALNRRHPLSRAITALFDAEQHRFTALLAFVQQRAKTLDPPPMALWLFGSVARGEDRADSDVDFAIVGRAPYVHRHAKVLDDALAEYGAEHGFVPTMTVITPAQLKRLAAADAPLWRALKQDAVILLGDAPTHVVTRA